MNVDENELIETFTTLIKLPLPQLKTSLFHKAKELEHIFADEIKEYRNIERMVDPEKKEKTEESIKEINFEIEKIKGHWTVSPVDIPQEIVNHIISYNLNPGIIKMQKFKLHGRDIDLSFEMQSRDYFTGSIKEKTTKRIPSKQSKQCGKMTDKKEVIKTIIAYLLNNEDLFNWMANEFFESWKPLIDNGCITTNER